MGRTVFRAVPLVCVGLIAFVSFSLLAQQNALVIQGGTLIDGNGGAPIANSVIIIQGNQITAAGPAGQAQVPAGAQVINANGKWILPGLWDCQQNFAWFYSELQLNQGVTSGCDIGNGDEWGIVHRDAINHGKIRGPRVWIGVAHLGATTPDQLTRWETPRQTRQVRKTVDEVRTVVTRFLEPRAAQVMFHD